MYVYIISFLNKSKLVFVERNSFGESKRKLKAMIKGKKKSEIEKEGLILISFHCRDEDFGSNCKNMAICRGTFVPINFICK